MGKTTEHTFMETPTWGTATADLGFANSSVGMHTTPQTPEPHQGSSLSWCHKKTELLAKSHKQDRSTKQVCMNNA